MTPYTASVGREQRTDIKCFTGDGLFCHPVMEAKRYKVLSHLFFPYDDITIWVDSNIALTEAPETIVEKLLGDADLAVFRHPFRQSVWQEFETLRKDQRFAIPYLQKQLLDQRESYREQGLPETTPLFECNVLIRRNNARVARLMDAWWAEICRWQWRDQVSFPFVLWKHDDVKVSVISDGNARTNPLFKHTERWATTARK